jgi:predicted nucleotidyltransferase
MQIKVPNDVREELLPKNMVLFGYRGSVSHNTFIPNTNPDSTDDVDLLGFYLAPREYYIGLGLGKVYKKAHERFVGQWDVVCYELRKVVGMLMNCNPNVMSMLWLRDNHYLPVDGPYGWAGELLVANRDAFTSKKAYNSYTGYAHSQLKKMTAHNKEGYMGQKRKALVDKYGYDTKNASHLIRLLKMGIEFLSTGQLNVFREDAPLLVDIKTGGWPLEKVQAEADRLFKLSEEALVRSKLPDAPDVARIESVVMDILHNYICGSQVE